MNIVIIGTGNMGKGLAARAAKAGERVFLAGRDLAKTRSIAKELGNGVEAIALGEATQKGELVVLAVPFGGAIAAIRDAGNLAKRIVVDLTNPLTPDFMALTIGFSTSAAEEIAKAAPGARVVKAFNTVFAPLFADGVKGEVPVYCAGDDEAASQVVRAFATRLGFVAVDVGPLSMARYLEPLAELTIQLAFARGFGTATPVFQRFG